MQDIELACSRSPRDQTWFGNMGFSESINTLIRCKTRAGCTSANRNFNEGGAFRQNHAPCCEIWINGGSLQERRSQCHFRTRKPSESYGVSKPFGRAHHAKGVELISEGRKICGHQEENEAPHLLYNYKWRKNGCWELTPPIDNEREKHWEM